jgi:hypothetical protein
MDKSFDIAWRQVAAGWRAQGWYNIDGHGIPPDAELLIAQKDTMSNFAL